MKRMILVFGIMAGMMGKSFGEGSNTWSILWGVSIQISIPNIIVSAINIHQINQTDRYGKVVPVLGIITGGFQILVGSSLLYSYPSPGYFNIAVGSTSLISSIWNLAKKKPQDSRTIWNIYSFPTHDKSMGMGLSYTLRF